MPPASADWPAAAPEMAWWGWAERKRRPRLPASATEFLAARLELDGRIRPPVELDAVRLRASRLPGRVRDRLAAAAGADGVRDDRRSRVRHAAGKSYADLIRQRRGDCRRAPDAVVYPGSHEATRAVLDACSASGVAVVPFGGGTSVVGGVDPVRDGFDAVISLDVGRLSEVVDVDRPSLTAVLEPGLRGPQVESALARLGLTLGHFPQSFEYATLGGYVATRSAGQASTGYGRIDELVLGVRCATPAGDLDLPPLPASAAGPQLRELVVGSEGTLGVITRAAVRVRPAPPVRRYEGWFFRSFVEGAEALRTVEQAGAAPDVARLSDESETSLSLQLAGAHGLGVRLGGLYLRARGYAGGCLAIVGWEGEDDDVARRRARCAGLLRRAGGLSVGRSPGRRWEQTRFAGPYLRDELLDRGVLVETLETAAQWSDLMPVYKAVFRGLDDALRARGTPGMIGCHISHLYPSGASLYFTFLARQEPGAEVEQWRVAKHAAGNAIKSAGGTITHHHAVGADHSEWMVDEVGATGLAALRATKEELDPAGIMNPGKLLPAGV
ncbi:MAG TPA: FAD-binding oxidoreductase [Solirubrobacteraceae bacterium]|nr:FAD-binding oxidoreductase [Solirubrobacteraceae bacterium]